MTATTTRAAETWAHILAQPDGLSMGYAADDEIAKGDPEDNYGEQVFGPGIDAVDAALSAVTAWLTAQEPPA